MCPPYFRADPQVRPYENIENYTWDTTLRNQVILVWSIGPIFIKSLNESPTEQHFIYSTPKNGGLGGGGAQEP